MAALPPFLLPEIQSLFSPGNDHCALPKGGVFWREVISVFLGR